MIPILNHLDCGIFEMSEYRLNFVPENKRPHLNVARSFIHKAVTGDVIVFFVNSTLHKAVIVKKFYHKIKDTTRVTNKILNSHSIL